FRGPRREHLAAPGGHDTTARAHRQRAYVVRVGERPHAGPHPGCDRARRAREAHRYIRRAVARLVRRLHGRRAIRRGAPGLTSLVDHPDAQLRIATTHPRTTHPRTTNIQQEKSCPPSTCTERPPPPRSSTSRRSRTSVRDARRCSGTALTTTSRS